MISFNSNTDLWVIDIREGFPKFMRVSPEGLALFLVEFVRVIREGCS